MPQYKVQAHFGKSSMKFKITDPEEITPAIEKKLKTLGFPAFWGIPAHRKISESSGGVQIVPDDADQSNNVPISGPAEGGLFECSYSPQDKCVTLTISGTFEVWTTDDISRFGHVDCLLVSGITLTDPKGKEIKFPKDAYGMARPIEANITGGYREPHQCYQIPTSFSITEQ